MIFFYCYWQMWHVVVLLVVIVQWHVLPVLTWHVLVISVNVIMITASIFQNKTRCPTPWKKPYHILQGLFEHYSLMIMVCNATFNNISVISWRSLFGCCFFFLVEEARVPRENHRLATRHGQTLPHNVVSSTPRLSGIQTHNFKW